MACSSVNNYCGHSIARCYNNNSQTVTAGTTTSLITGSNTVVLNGNGVSINTNGYQINKAGIYNISADICITGTAAGDVTFEVLLDGVALPCTLRTVTLGTSGTDEIVINTDVQFNKICPCTCAVNHSLTFAIVSAGAGAGSVINCCTGVNRIDD